MSEALRVFYNASAVPRRPAGAGVYTLELAKALARRDDVELVVASPGGEIPGAEHVSSPDAGPLRRSTWEQWSMPALIREANAELYHGPHFAVPVRGGVPRVATVHDLTFHRLPKRYDIRRRTYYRALARLSARAERIIVPSGAVAAEVARYLSYPPERIRVVPEAPRAGLAAASASEVDALRQRLGVEDDYLLCVGTAEPGKRAVDAVRALALLRERGIGVPLVLAGNPGPLSPALEREAERLGVGSMCRFVGYVPDEDLAALYSGALALVFPSLYEGFGLPPLEAMACGTPVISTQAPAMAEVLGGAALFVPLRSPEAIAESVCRLRSSESERQEWAERAREHVRQFSWDHAAALTVDVYREVVA